MMADAMPTPLVTKAVAVADGTAKSQPASMAMTRGAMIALENCGRVEGLTRSVRLYRTCVVPFKKEALALGATPSDGSRSWRTVPSPTTPADPAIDQ